MRDVGRTREEFVNHEPQASGLRIIPVYNSVYIPVYNSEDAQRTIVFPHFFLEDARGFIVTITHSWLTNQSARIYLVII